MTIEHGNDADYRLPATAVPTRYSLRVDPDIGRRCFEGEVAVELTVTAETTELVLNAAELEVGDASLAPAGGGSSRPLEVALQPELERVVFSSREPVGPGDYVLSCAFRGTLNDKLRGFYRSRFTDPEGNEREIASTHFEAADARRAFPCFDEPELKAVFSVTLDVEEGLFALSNAPEQTVTPLEGGKRRIVFEDTMKMSSYLVAYAVGPLEATEAIEADGVPLRVVVPAGKLHLTSYALEVASHALSWYHRYFDIAYPSQKLDLVAIPDFSMGAMENLGCVIFREQDLLCDPSTSSVPELSRIAEVIEHEIAHMWFGDLVTMKWWNGIWLNEAFATFMSVSCLDDFRPEWNRWVTFGTEKDLALGIDGLHSTRPIEFPVRAPDEADAMFDHLTYLKGGNVLRMVEQYLGTERFRDGVRRYLAAHAYGNTETTDLWDAIESVSVGEPVRALLDSWIFQGGHPLVSARLEGGEVVLTQEPFTYLPDEARPAGSPPSKIGRDWLVPIRFESRPGQVVAEVLGPRPHGSEPLRLPAGDGLPVVNAGGSGTYRLRYDGPLFDRLLSRLGDLEPLERFNLVSDSWACTLAGLVAPGDFLALGRRLEEESDPNVWGVVAGALGLIDFAAAGLAEAAFSSLVRELVTPELERLGFDVSPTDSPERQRTRSIFLNLLGSLGDDESVRERATAAFSAARSGGPAIPASIAQAVLNVVVSTGGRHAFDEVREGFRHAADPLIKNRHLIALGAVREAEPVAEVLEMTRSEIRTQDAHHVLRRLMQSRHAGPQTWSFVTEHWDELLERLPAHAMPTVFGGVSYLVQVGDDGSQRYLEEVRRFAADHPLGGQQLLIDQALERQAINARFVNETRSSIGELLEKA